MSEKKLQVLIDKELHEEVDKHQKESVFKKPDFVEKLLRYGLAEYKRRMK